MRVALQTWGSDGDIRPMIALAAGLVRRGHRATLSIGSVDNKDYRPMCSAVGVESIAAPARAHLDVTKWLGEMGRTRNPITMLRFLHERALFPSFPEMVAAAEPMADAADLVIGHFVCAPMRIAAAKRKLPYASVSFWPGLISDPARAPEGLPNLGRFLNQQIWRAAFALIDRAVGEGYRELFRAHGVQQPFDVMDTCYSPELNLIASSGRLWPHARDAGPHRFVGAFTLPGEAEPEPLPEEIERFLAAGEPPLFLTLGSMGQLEPEASERLLVEAAQVSGLRALVQHDPRRPLPAKVSDRLQFIGRTNHAALFPRCVAVLHHGGAGTTHTSLAAGRPAVICGFMEEQLSWGRALERSGSGAGVFRYGYSSAKKIGAALGKAGRDLALRARAAELGALVRAEEGVEEACRHLEALAAARR